MGDRDFDELVDELARVLWDPDQARVLVLRVGFPPGSVPAFSTPRMFWSRVVGEAENGRLAGGARLLARELRKQFPGNSVLARLEAELSAHDAGARDLMAPNTEPTDAELAAVMDAARDLAMERQASSDAWVAARLEDAARFAREQRDSHGARRGGKTS